MAAVSEELAVLKLVAARLDGAGIPHMVSGSTAMNYYAEPRMTRDIDIVVELGPADVERVEALFSPDFYCDAEMVRDAVARRGMFNVIHRDAVVKVDFIVRKDTPYRQMEFSRRRSVSVDDARIWLVAAEDLVLSKLEWAKDSRSELQRRDVRNLIDCVAALDWPYLQGGTRARGGRPAGGGPLVTDTAETVRIRYRAMLMARPGTERLKMGSNMFDAARALVRASLGDATGTDRSPALKARLFERVYGRDFSPQATRRVIDHLWAGSAHGPHRGVTLT
jgi:hypothetical protein